MNAMAMPTLAEPILTVKDLKVHFPITRGVLRRTVGQVKAVDGVSFEVMRGETLGLVGESGCGKTTTGRSLLRIVEATAGSITFRRPNGEELDVTGAGRPQLKALRREMRMVFQDPNASLNPRLPVGEIIGQGMEYAGMSRSEIDDRVAELLQKVGLRPEYVRRYPHAFSGGERQRIGIARALSLNSRLRRVRRGGVGARRVGAGADPQAAAQLEARARSHLPVRWPRPGGDPAYLRPRRGDVCEASSSRWRRPRTLYAAPKHPYTEALLSAVPRPDPRLRRQGQRIRLAGEVADVSNLPPGCAFHPRCRYATDLCRQETPALRTLGNGQSAACHYAETLSLVGTA